MYCIFPFTNLEESKTMKGDDRMGCFKFGMTATSFQKRFDQYHTSFPAGVYIFALLSELKIPIGTRNTPRKTKTQFYLIVEKFMFECLRKLGAEQIRSTARIKSLGTDPGAGGVTEYFHCSIAVTHEAIRQTWKKFGGTMELFTPDDDGKDFNKTNRVVEQRALYIGNVPFV
jgi:hypothetical protein